MNAGVPTPRYEMRRRLALSVFRRLDPGHFLEAGCGLSALLEPLARLGFTGVGLEVSDATAPTAAANARATNGRVRVVQSLAEVTDETFDHLFSFEVLEHIEDDLEELRKWSSLVKPGGDVVISVPAHAAQWTAADDAVGRHRRYERDELGELMSASGIEPRLIWSYGFPVTAVTRKVRALQTRAATSDQSLSREERTLVSANVSHAALPGASSARPVMLAAGWLAHVLQLPFLGSELGDGWFAVGRRL